ncbi:MAG TPA: hypothetical protein VGU69_05835 [Rhizomicrobium sp.]|nr:hypothetical protein [Rhizomicrobium sp.]
MAPQLPLNRCRLACGKVGITTACMLFYVQVTDPVRLPPQRFPKLETFAAHCRAMDAFQATSFDGYAVSRVD